MRRKGHLIIVSGPSGVGKGTVCEEIMRQRPSLKLSISATTRPKRPHEVSGESYFFYSMEEFQDLIAQNKLIEYAKVHGNFYGTPRDYVMENLEKGEDVILEIDVQGAMQVKENLDEGVFIFLLPPEIQDLADRLHHRGTEDEDQIALRLKNSQGELANLHNYDYAVVNDKVETCAETILHIIDAENQRIDAGLMKKYREEYND